jgi:protein arginine kinase activator
MLCQACHENEATVHLTEIKGDKMVTLHLCQECAQRKGIKVKPPFSLDDFLSGLAELNIAPEEEAVTCPGCGITLAEFRAAGRLGCGQCYRVFSRSLLPLIATIQKGEIHRGKIPAAHPPRPDPESLEEALQEAVGKEDFERAALLRDRIKQLGKRKDED